MNRIEIYKPEVTCRVILQLLSGNGICWCRYLPQVQNKNNHYWAVVVAQLVERLLLIPEVRSLNPVIAKNLY